MSLQNNKRVAIIGAGAAGLLAAGTSLLHGADVTIFEHQSKAGRKLLITGKGRCNVTNDCTPAEFLQSVITNPRFLYSAIYSFSPQDTMALIEKHGTPLKTERGRRVFPVSDISGDVLSALLRYAKGSTFIHEHVERLIIENGTIKGLKTTQNEYAFDTVIVATGGLSYPRTGSDGSGYLLAKQAGHEVLPLQGSLVPLVSHDSACAEMQGLSLRNVGIKVTNPSQKVVYEDFGELMFAHFGITGPTVLSASSHLTDTSLEGYAFHIDLKPALSTEELDSRLLSDFSRIQNKEYKNALGGLLPQKMIPVFIKRTGIDEEKKVHSLTKSDRSIILQTLKDFVVTISLRRPIEEAVITRGGVNTKEINPKTMQSKLCEGLFFAGEIIDTDAYTGGYNLQIAFSTGYLAGTYASAQN